VTSPWKVEGNVTLPPEAGGNVTLLGGRVSG
jgi:hypothetical protein